MKIMMMKNLLIIIFAFPILSPTIALAENSSITELHLFQGGTNHTMIINDDIRFTGLYPSVEIKKLTDIMLVQPQSLDVEARKKLSMIKVASQYRRVTDGVRSLDDVIKIFNETNTDFIFQGWMRQNPCPENCSDLPPNQIETCRQLDYSHESLRNATSKIKMEMPDVIFGGGFLAEFLNPESMNELTGETFDRNDTWNMSLDPSKWGIPKSRNDFQTDFAIGQGWIEASQPYDPKQQMHYYFPDITNSDVKDLFLSWTEKQIDGGVDSIWIDALYGQPQLLWATTGDINHSAVNESYEAASGLIDKIHESGLSKGRYIYVISWAMPIMFEVPYSSPDLDGFMITIGTEEIRELKMNETKWDSWIKKINEKFGNVPIFARIDYGNVDSPLAVFSQELTMDQSNQFIRIADDFFKQKGIIFIYPIHGGNMGGLNTSIAKLSYGSFDWYDSLAPEFQTYDTIKELSSASLPTPTPSSTPLSILGGSGGGGGGGGVTSGENFTNIEMKEKRDNYIFKDNSSSYKFVSTDPIMYVNITGNINAGEVTTIVEVLKSTSALLKNNSTPPGIVYKNVNIWVGTSDFATPENIKQGIIGFRVMNSWLENNGLETGEIKIMKWNLSEWVQLETEETSGDDAYTYYEARTNVFSQFAITAFKLAPAPTADVIQTPSVMKVSPIPTLSPAKKGVLGIKNVLTVTAVITAIIIAILIIAHLKERKIE